MEVCADIGIVDDIIDGWSFTGFSVIVVSHLLFLWIYPCLSILFVLSLFSHSSHSLCPLSSWSKVPSVCIQCTPAITDMLLGHALGAGASVDTAYYVGSMRVAKFDCCGGSSTHIHCKAASLCFDLKKLNY